MNVTCAEGVIENQKEYMQPIVSVDDVELALGTINTSGKHNIQYDVFYKKILCICIIYNSYF